MALKEIVTKAVVGKAKKISSNNITIEPENTVNTVLGCWVINHTFMGKNNDNKVNIEGAYDVNVWYSFDSDSKTAVSSKRYTYNDVINVPLKEDVELNDDSEIIVRCLKQPTVDNVSVNGGVIELKVEKELGVEIVGDAKVKINVEDDYDDYEEVFDEITDEEIKSIDDDYLEEKSDS